MVDLLNLFVEKYQLNYSYHDVAKDSLNLADGSDLVINPHSYKIDRFMNFSYGFPFMTTPEFIFTRKPAVEVRDRIPIFYNNKPEPSLLIRLILLVSP